MPKLSRRVRMSSKGQVVIPQEIREHLGLHAGDELVVHVVSDRMFAVELPEPTPLEKALARMDEHNQAHPLTPEEIEQALKEAREEVYAERQRRADAA